MRIWAGIAGLALMLGVAMPVAAQEAPADTRYALQADPGGGIWVVDQVKGLVSRCAPNEARAARVVDVVFGMPVPRPRAGSGGEPICSDWVAADAPDAIRPKILGGAGDTAGGTFSGQ